MIEVVGDSARGEEFALVRLAVDGDRILDADAPGLERPLRGLTLLEAAAVGGETLAVDALANALGPVFRAAGRRPHAVAMSGGVDSAVTFLRAGGCDRGDAATLGRPGRARLGARVLLAGSRARRARDVPLAGPAARDARPPRAVQARRRRSLRPRVRRGETPNPCTRCNGTFRFAELLAFARRAGATRLATGHYARVVEPPRPRLLRGRDADKDQSYMLATLAPRLLPRVGFPLGEPTKDETRLEAERAGLAAARRPESQEACFLGGDDYRAFLARRGLASEARVDRGRGGNAVGEHDGYWRYTPGQRRGLGVAAAEPLYALRTEARSNTVVVGPRALLARSRVEARGRPASDASRAHAKLRYRSRGAGDCAAVPGWLRAGARRARVRRRPGTDGGALRRRRVVGAGVVSASAA